MAKTKKVYRDAKTGRFTSKADVKQHPATTETETRPSYHRRKSS